MSGPRLAPPRVPSGTITVQAPPELTPGDGAGGMLTSMLPMLGSIGAIVMVSVSNTGPTGFLTGGMFLLSSLGFVAVNGWRQRSQRTTATLAARREYLAYLTELRKTVRVAARQQRRSANWALPAPSTLPFIAEERTRVWERSPGDTDFLSVRVGTSDQPLCLALEAPELPPLAQLDPVAASAAHRFMLTHETQKNLPVGITLRDYARIEVTGGEAEARGLARAMLLHAATMHDPDSLQIVIAAEDAALPQWEWAKWLPHAHSRRVSDALGPARMIGSSVTELGELLPSDVRERPRFARDGSPAKTPHVVFVTDGAHIPMSDILLAGDGTSGVTVIDLPARWGELDDPDALRIAFDDSGDAAELITLQLPARRFTPDTVSIVEAEATARRLMPLYSMTSTEKTTRGSTKQEELIDLLGLPDVRDIDFDVAWQPRLERDRLRVPIGQDTTGLPIVLDIKESAQQGMGPHGVMIGATGSGKSEVLRTLVLALALTHSPEQLNFVLVDFKGGATFAGMAGMPHVSAIITNLGDEISLVDRFQDALQGEVVRRQELLRASGNFANVSDYEKARRGGRTDLAPLPALLIVADEFSELLAAKPEFVESFVNIGRVGRSLQVHLLLASQRLEEGKLRGLDTYLSYRVGLRTFSAAESRSILGVPDAYTLPQQPGVGFLKSDTETMTQFRAAYVSGPPPRRRRAISSGTSSSGSSEASVELFTAAPSAKPEPTDDAPAIEPTVSEPEEKRSTFEIAVERMSGRGPVAHRVWLPPLETPATLDQLFGDLTVDPALGLVSRQWRAVGGLTVPLGIVDVPLEQRRENLVISLGGAAGHMAIVGAPLSGKSTLARTTMVALALTHTPLEVQFFVLDFGGGSFSGLQSFPHLSGLATRSEPDVVRRTIAEVMGLLNAREVYFRQNGIDSIDTYRQRRATGQVDDGYGDVFLVIDGWSTLRGEFEALEAQIQTIAARGLTYGIHIVITAARWMEVRANLKDLIGTRVELRLGDSTDSEINRKAAANVTAIPGRGLNAAGLQMLTALPRIDGVDDASSLADGVDHVIEQVTAAWTGPAGPKLRLLPESISLDEIRPLLAPDSREIVLGIDEADLAPFTIDPLEEPHLYLYGDSDSGKSSMLRAYAHEIMRLYTPKEAKIFVLDYRRALLGEIPQEYLGAYLTAHDMAMSGVAELAAFFQSRIPGPDVTPEQLRSRSWWTGAEGFILVDDYDLVSTSLGNPLAAIAPLLAQASDLGLHVILTRRAGGASRAAYDPIIQRLTDLGTTGILLSGNPEEGQLIGKVKAAPAVPGRAQIVSRSRGVVAAQLAWVPPHFS
ncbi:type VII secretion protein EccCa [Agromyces atrinae]|uniref:S-DNA-T family DNA segregation ATPase FtsK/SpoIIIE n=1 Tax=Agromyces atrinae TaxID=592376 RepID=A0A4Q2M4G3_9MICO|nr:type VII secretion protein EccCa [Agromyces atrinae]NYD67211.1 S-DNA-T family DNA segregation ATPase FtsK/SpoIIIE [Agromyces atrinae]RXZ86955.1 type VII secretion protein EccCa [Agromyces atrinae]